MADVPPIDATVTRIQAWLLACDATNQSLADAAGVDEKTIRQAMGEGWNPTVETIRKLESLIPKGWQAGDPVAALGGPARAKARAA